MLAFLGGFVIWFICSSVTYSSTSYCLGVVTPLTLVRRSAWSVLISLLFVTGFVVGFLHENSHGMFFDSILCALIYVQVVISLALNVKIDRWLDRAGAAALRAEASRRFGRPGGHSGFTLVELLVVCALITTLVGITCAVAGRARSWSVASLQRAAAPLTKVNELWPSS